MRICGSWNYERSGGSAAGDGNYEETIDNESVCSKRCIHEETGVITKIFEYIALVVWCAVYAVLGMVFMVAVVAVFTVAISAAGVIFLAGLAVLGALYVWAAIVDRLT